jgi:hypothetical protein
VNKTSKPAASTLSCLFASLAQEYPESNLKPCETKNDQSWRHASGSTAKERIKPFAKYFPELSSLFNYLDNYSICERHYNQIIAKNTFLKKLQEDDVIYDSINTNTANPHKRSRNSLENEFLQLSLTSQDQNLLLELEGTRKKLIESENQRVNYVGIINENNKRIIELECQNKNLIEENEMLKEKLNNRFNDQQTRIEAIKEIANYERKNLYNDIINLINDQDRFSLDSLLKYSTSEWLAKQNPVVVKFIETLIAHEGEDNHKGEKNFKCAVAVDAIYGARHRRYVSSINLAASAIKYSIAKSKTIIDLDNHFLSSGGFNKFIQWQEDLAHKPTPLSNGLLFLAFDNEQKGQKNYLDRGNNTVIFHTVTSFISFNFDPTNNIQVIKNPWLHQKLNSTQIQELFEITPDMQALLDKELQDYLSIILTDACKEKNSEINLIDNLILNNPTIGKQKRCIKCGLKEIENSKRKCPQCNQKLSTLAETQQEMQGDDDQSILETNTTKPLKFKHYQNNTNVFNNPINTISITQKASPQDGVKVPDISVPDPLPLNPNSIDNVRKVLDHIQEISGINEGERKWIAVACDGVPFNYAQKIKNDYPNILLIPGPLHEEMNMLKSFVELNW